MVDMHHNLLCLGTNKIIENSKKVLNLYQGAQPQNLSANDSYKRGDT